MPGLARFTASEMVAVTMGFAAPASATLGLFCIQYRRCERDGGETQDRR